MDKEPSAGALARRHCRQEYDGLLWLQPAASASGISELTIWNRDGSHGQLCLNGLRMAALWTGEPAGEFLMAGRRIPWRKESAGIRLHLRREDLPEQLAFQRVKLGDRAGLAVPFWNPHCVVPVERLADLDLAELADLANQRKDVFPKGVNLEAVAAQGNSELRVRVWERGVGETRACGSGAVAVALTYWAGGGEGPVSIVMAGGRLQLSPEPNGGIFLTGPARLSGSIWLED
ncbi:MAG: hypothetical protein DWQ01_20790 [Planctomycetota bacterium]|nr:MAG: hypothetical protein DWQ01_20790 [Planctomycetota bacterium]